MINKKLPVEDRSISYAIEVQNIVLTLIGLSFLLFIFLFIFTNPFVQIWAFWLFWINSCVFLSGIFCYFQFWYFFSFKSSIIYIQSVNKMVLSSIVNSSIVTFMFSLLHTDQLNYLTMILLITLFICSYLFFK